MVLPRNYQSVFERKRVRNLESQTKRIAQRVRLSQPRGSTAAINQLSRQGNSPQETAGRMEPKGQWNLEAFVLSQRNLPKDFNLICPVQSSAQKSSISRIARARRTRAWRAAKPADRNDLLQGLRQNVFCRNRHQHIPAFTRDDDGIPGAAAGELDVVGDELACRRQRRRV